MHKTCSYLTKILYIPSTLNNLHTRDIQNEQIYSYFITLNLYIKKQKNNLVTLIKTIFSPHIGFISNQKANMFQIMKHLMALSWLSGLDKPV